MALFLSTFVNKVDSKGRISVPATFRAALAELPFKGIVAFRSFAHPCIEGCGIDRMEALSAGTDDFAAFSAEQDDLSALIFADARQLSFDSEGRVMLPEDLIVHAGIDGRAAFVGMGKTFRIWNPDTFADHQEEARRRALEKRPTVRIPKDGGAP